MFQVYEIPSFIFHEMEKALIEHLSCFVTKARLELFKKVLSNRTDYIAVVLEDIFHPHNASAVLRSCDCFGIQDVHIIENRHEYNVNPDVALGASKWLTLNRYRQQGINNTLDCLSELKRKGYRIIATSPDNVAKKFPDIEVNKGPFALVFGGERTGVSDSVKEIADEYVTIPMVGFTESLNISVAAAILLQHFAQVVRTTNLGWQIGEEKYNALLLNWLRKSIRRVEIIEKDFLMKSCGNVD